MADLINSGLGIEDNESDWKYDNLEECILEDYEDFPENINTLEEFDEWLAQ